MGPTEEELLERLRAGDEQTLGGLFDLHRERLLRLVHFRMDRRLFGRVDADDVLQETYLAAAQRLRHYLEKPTQSFFIWLRMLVGQTLVDIHRQHLGAQMRDAGREVSLQKRPAFGVTSASMVIQLLGNLTSPSQAALKAELTVELERALEQMSELDQEVLALRHFEELSNSETAEALGIQPKAASIRYVRAIKRLKDILREIPGLFDNP